MQFSPWPRPLFVPGGELTLSFVVYAPELLRWDFTLLAEGSPIAAVPPGLNVQLFTREAAPDYAEWADELLRDPEAPHADALAGAGFWYEVSGTLPNMPDLTTLQAAWALVRVLCRAGALSVWDAIAMRWTAAEEVLAADPAHPALAAAWGVHLAEVDPGTAPVVVYTLGLTKFGRRDLIAFGTAENAQFLRQLLHGIGLDLVEGAQIDSGAELEKAGIRLRATGYNPGFNGPEVGVPFFAQPLLLTPLA